MIRILTLANKPALLQEAIASVKAQTRTDFSHTVVMDTDIDWGRRYPPAVFYNGRARECGPDDYVCWLSDDDVLLPNFLADLAGYLDDHPEIGACYGGAEQYIYRPPDPPTFYRCLPGGNVWPIYTRQREPAGHLDGGQWMVRRSVLDKITYPYAPEHEMARCSDGVLANKIAAAVGIYPLPGVVVHLRTTPLSANVCTEDGKSIVAVEWRERRWGAR